MHHLEMEANEAESDGEEAPEELGPAPGTNATHYAMPPSPVSSVSSTTQVDGLIWRIRRIETHASLVGIRF
jgi:hypothetical protein